MAIVKLSRSGKAVLFVDDDGNVFMTSVKYLEGILSGRFSGFGLLVRFPNRVREGQFRKSLLVGEEFSKPYGEEGGLDPFRDGEKLAKLKEENREVGDLDEW